MKSETLRASKEQQQEQELRRGPWTLEEDTLLIHYVACHGEGRWNLLAKSAGLKRTGKSCRLRWLNYLKPDIKRGNLTSQEQLLILELHSKWGNRWSKIAAHLPGRTDNEIKNYWRTRVQKQARQLNMESNSQSFVDAIRCFYMPRLVQKIEQSSTSSTTLTMNSSECSTDFSSPSHNAHLVISPDTLGSDIHLDSTTNDTSCSNNINPSNISEIPYLPSSLSDCYNVGSSNDDVEMASMSASDIPFSGCHVLGHDWLRNDMAEDSMWELDELWQFRK